jgi:hypothetical protein
MGFNIKPNFNIYLDNELYFQDNSNFEEFLEHQFYTYEDIMELGIKQDTKFFKQFEYYAKLINQPGVASHFLSPIAIPEFKDWQSVVMKANTPSLIFTVIQLAFFLSKKHSKSSITFAATYDKIYKNTISILDGEIKVITYIIEDHPTYEEFVATEKLTILHDEIILIFKKLQEKTN